MEQLFSAEGEFGEDSTLLDRLKGPAITKMVQYLGPPNCEKCEQPFGALGTIKSLYYSMPVMECRFCNEPYSLSKYIVGTRFKQKMNVDEKNIINTEKERSVIATMNGNQTHSISNQ